MTRCVTVQPVRRWAGFTPDYTDDVAPPPLQRQWSPAELLWLAVLIDAVELATEVRVLRYVPDHQEAIASARAWFLRDEAEPFSFVWVAHHLHLDHHSIRAGVLAAIRQRRRILCRRER